MLSTDLRCAAKILIKQDTKPSILLALRPSTECFISHRARARQCFNCFKEPIKHPWCKKSCGQESKKGHAEKM